MTKVIFDISMSLDGFVTAPGVSPEEPPGDGSQRLHEWAFSEHERNRELLAEAVNFVGAVIAGRPVYRDAGARHLFGPVVQRRQTRDEWRGKGDRRGPQEHQVHGPVRGGRPDGAVSEEGRALVATSTFGDRIHRSVGAPRSARSGDLRRPPRSQAVLGSSAKGV
jgi:hypothetical protein